MIDQRITRNFPARLPALDCLPQHALGRGHYYELRGFFFILIPKAPNFMLGVQILSRGSLSCLAVVGTTTYQSACPACPELRRRELVEVSTAYLAWRFTPGCRRKIHFLGFVFINYFWHNKPSSPIIFVINLSIQFYCLLFSSRLHFLSAYFSNHFLWFSFSYSKIVLSQLFL